MAQCRLGGSAQLMAHVPGTLCGMVGLAAVACYNVSCVMKDTMASSHRSERWDVMDHGTATPAPERRPDGQA